jgi:hypothetical protein
MNRHDRAGFWAGFKEHFAAKAAKRAARVTRDTPTAAPIPLPHVLAPAPAVHTPPLPAIAINKKDIQIGRIALREAFAELDDDDRRPFDYKNVARWLSMRRDQVVDGLRFESRKTGENKNQWRVIQIA